MENNNYEGRSVSELLKTNSSLGAFTEKRIRRSRDFKFFGVTQSRTGSPDLAQYIKIIFSNNEQILISYHQLSQPVKYEGSSMIEISADSLHLKIMGRGLENIMDYIAEQRLMWIKEPSLSEDAFLSLDEQEDETVIIDSIERVMMH